MNCSNAKPFLKWVGGKTQLIEQFKTLYPNELENNLIDTYIEPFVGGGAIFFHLMQTYKIKKAIIIDLNSDLIECYQCIKEDVNKLIGILEQLQTTFFKLNTIEQKKMYLGIREEYNSLLNKNYDKYTKAAYMIFMNKTCFNGLYRVNSKGEYNVPFGMYKNPLICNKSNLLVINELLQNVEIVVGDYSLCEKYIYGKTFIYFDPPYRPLTITQSFVGYSKYGFNDNNQIELATLYKKISDKNCNLMLSNSDPKNVNVNDNFFDDLYSEFNINRIYAKRVINCQGNKRGNLTEIVIRNYSRKDKKI